MGAQPIIECNLPPLECGNNPVPNGTRHQEIPEARASEYLPEILLAVTTLGFQLPLEGFIGFALIFCA
jgi:hypothetical protein